MASVFSGGFARTLALAMAVMVGMTVLIGTWVLWKHFAGVETLGTTGSIAVGGSTLAISALAYFFFAPALGAEV